MKGSRIDKNLRLRDMIALESKRFRRRTEKMRWEDSYTALLPVISGNYREKDWAKRLKEKVKSYREL